MNFTSRQLPDFLRYQTRSQVRVRSEIACRNAIDGGMPRQVDRVGNQGSGGVGQRGMAGQDGGGIGNSQGKAAATPSAGCDSANRIIAVNGCRSEHGWL